MDESQLAFVKWLAVLISVTWFISGLVAVLFPDTALKVNRAFAPKQAWEMFERIGFASRKSQVIAGCVAMLGSAVFFALFMLLSRAGV